MHKDKLKNEKLEDSWIFALTFNCSYDNRHLGAASLAGSVPGMTQCNSVPGLVAAQLEVCKQNPESLSCISHGAKQGILECQQQFRYERWNCSFSKSHKLIARILKKGKFIYSQSCSNSFKSK